MVFMRSQFEARGLPKDARKILWGPGAAKSTLQRRSSGAYGKPRGHQMRSKRRLGGALMGPGRTKSAHGSECPGKGQEADFFGVPFGTPFALHFCSRSGLFFIKKSRGFQVPEWIKNESQNDSIFDPNSTLFSMKIYIDVLIDFVTLFGSILESFLEQIRLRNRASTGKNLFLKMSVSPARGAHFE